MEKEKNYFEELNSVNVADKTEKKGKLTYLSWAWAWAELKKRFPDSTYKIYETEDGLFYHTDGRTCWVKTGVTVNGIENIEYLPIMNNYNKSIKLEDVTSFDVNTAIQRSLTKAVARHGLGLYIYAGEDLPEDAAEENAEPKEEKKEKGKAKEPKEEKKSELKATPKQIELLHKLVAESDWKKMLDWVGVEKVEDMTAQKASEIITAKTKKEA